MNHYKTAAIAKLIGIHPNTVRFYEQMGLLADVPRKKNNYRIFTDRHLSQLRLIRSALRNEVLSANLRAEAIELIKLAAVGDYDAAICSAKHYKKHLQQERLKAEEAIQLIKGQIKGDPVHSQTQTILGRQKMANTLGVTIDVLRGWERNGLIHILRGHNGYCEYSGAAINRLKIIYILRNAHYSMMSILRMFRRLEQGTMDLKRALDTPDSAENIVHGTDCYISSLRMAEQDITEILKQLSVMKKLK